MGVLYDGATQFHQGSFGTIQNSPVLSIWFRPDTLPVLGGYLLQWGSSGLGGGRHYSIGILDDTGVCFARHRWQNALGTVIEEGTAVTANACTTGVWNHLLGYFAPVDVWQRAAILNGGTIATDATAVTASVVNTLTIGKNNNGGTAFFDGSAAEACVWDADNSIPFMFDYWDEIAASIYNFKQTANWWHSNYIDGYYPLRDGTDPRAWFTNNPSGTPTSFPLTATGGPTDTDSPILNPPWAISSYHGVFRPKIQLVGRAQILGTTQLG